MTGGQEKSHEADFRRLRKSLNEDAHSGAPLALKDFQKQAETFWNHPYTKKLREESGASPGTGRRADLAATLSGQSSRLRAAIGEDDGSTYELRRSWTLRDGVIVDIAGDDAPLPPEEELLVVTTSSTITTATGLVSYVEVHVFEQSRRP